MSEDNKLSYLRSTKGYSIATRNMTAQQIECFEQEYLSLCPLKHGGIAGNYVIGTDNNLMRFYLSIDNIKQVYLLNEKRNAKIVGITYFTKTHFFLVMNYVENNKLYERRFVLNKETEEKNAIAFVQTLIMRNPLIKVGA